MKDLVILAADRDLEFAVKGLLARPEALGIRAITSDIFIEPMHDPACARRGVRFLAGWTRQYRHGLLMFDHEGSGKEDIPRRDLQNSLNEEFSRSAWGERARAIVLSPELETWVWSDSPHVDAVAGWENRKPSLRAWLIEQGLLRQGENKPSRPKEAFEAALRAARKPRSSSLYGQLAGKVSFYRCTDPAFLEFKDLLDDWFPVETEVQSRKG